MRESSLIASRESLWAFARVLICGLFLMVEASWAQVPFPYSRRTRAYSGYQATVRGDNETVGMAGATVAVPNSISSLETNPAGLTMTMGSVTAQINSNEITDRELTPSEGDKIRSSQWGLTATPSLWGFAISSYTPSFEGGRFISPNTGRIQEYEVSTRQFRISASRALFNRQLSLGASLELNHAARQIGGVDDGATGLSFQLGAIYHIQNHFLFGISYSPPLELGSSLPNSGGAELPGFSQPIRTPMLLNTGLGWIPNRYFSAGAAIVVVGSTENTALLKDETVTVGEGLTLQPRAGASYVFGHYRNLKLGVAAGSYYEVSRTQERSNRLHGTFALQVNPYFVNTGIGVDRAERFNNFFVSIGFDIVRTARFFRIIPKDPVPPLRGFFPPPLRIQADGLPDGLTVGERKRYEAPSVSDVKDIIENIPQNIENRLEGKPSVQEQEERAKQKRRLKKKKPAQPKPTPQPADTGLKPR